MLRSIGKQKKRKARPTVERTCKKEGFKPGMKE